MEGSTVAGQVLSIAQFWTSLATILAELGNVVHWKLDRPMFNLRQSMIAFWAPSMPKSSAKSQALRRPEALVGPLPAST